MTIDKAVMMVIGVVVLASLALALYVDMNWLWLTAFMGLNLVQASITGFCPGAWLFKKMGMQPGCTFYAKEQRKAGNCCCASTTPEA